MFIYTKQLMSIYVRMVKIFVSFKNGNDAFTKMYLF